jgi:8-hydroxy-5-deazaflavin:NADPH oxidoreductase
LADWAAQTGGKVGSFEEAAASGELIVLSTLWANGATENALNLANPANFAGKVVIDTTNPLDFSTGTLRLAVGHTDSAGEIIQRQLPGAHVVKAFNIVTAAAMVNPGYTGGEPDMFIGGDDASAKQTVTQILRDFGWKGVIDLGGIETARYLEPLAVVWCLHYFATKNDAFAFKFVGA